MGEAKKKKAAATKAALDAFDQSFAQSMDAEKAELEGAPKAHNVEAGEYVEEVDPKLADKHLKD